MKPEKIFSNISNQFLISNDYEHNINYALKQIGENSNINRICLYCYTNEYNNLESRFEWLSDCNCSDKVTYPASIFNGIERAVGLNDQLIKKYSAIPCIDNTNSIFIIPVKVLNKIEGYMEIDSIEKDQFSSIEEEEYFVSLCNLVAMECIKYKNSNSLKEAEDKLKNLGSQLMQNEKMANIGYLAAGVAHEINNPLGFVSSNFDTLKKYMQLITDIIEKYKEIYNDSKINAETKEYIASKIKEIITESDLEFIFQDFDDLFYDTKEGISRISTIVKGLRNFSHKANQDNFEEYNLNSGVKDTLIICKNEIKYSAKIEEDLGDVPVIKAIPGNINEVLLNLIINASQAIKAKQEAELGLIKISTRADDAFIYCEISDTGTGIAKENLENIFKPFFTTKPVGVGTGLGLSISYEIINNIHHGEISLTSTIGVGTKFTIKLPINNEKIDI